MEAEKKYIVDKAKRNRKCKAGKSCTNPVIEKGSLSFGTRGEMKGHPTVFWRHLGCATKKQFTGAGIDSIKSLEDNVDFVLDAKEKVAAKAALMKIVESEPAASPAKSTAKKAAAKQKAPPKQAKKAKKKSEDDEEEDDTTTDGEGSGEDSDDSSYGGKKKKRAKK